jgi:hypothetical protein
MIKYLVIHCTGTPEGRDYSRNEVRRWFRSRGWKHDGYHLLIHLDGKISVLQPLNTDSIIEPHEVANGAKSYNKNSIHISYVGGTEKNNLKIAKDTRTELQKYALEVISKYFVLLNPNIGIVGHNQISNKACPSFDVTSWLTDIGLESNALHVMIKSDKKVNKKQIDLFD